MVDRSPAPASDLWAPRWRGQPGRLEVTYATFTDRATGTGIWLHHEMVASPAVSSGGARSNTAATHTTAWAAVFPVDGVPRWCRTESIDIDRHGSKGVADSLSWDLHWNADDQRPLYTFPRWAWHRELLPAAQVVPAPHLDVTGSFNWEDASIDEVDAVGGVARIFGHGNAQRWGWLHADLGDGDVMELVTAVSMRPGLNRLPAVTHVRFRIGGVDWPSLDAPSFLLGTRLSKESWTVRGRIGRSKLLVNVLQPAERCVAIDYHDPDGATATCHNTERADVEIRLTGGPNGDRVWTLDGTGHSEVGTRP